jgi:hypothetical protein
VGVADVEIDGLAPDNLGDVQRRGLIARLTFHGRLRFGYRLRTAARIVPPAGWCGKQFVRRIRR